MAKGISPTQRTLRHLREQGWHADIVERFNHFAGPFGIRHDAFGFIDILCIGENSIIAVQSCGQSFSEHNKKILANEFAPAWLQAGGRILLIGWRKIKLHRGGKAERWSPRIQEYSVDMFGKEKAPTKSELPQISP